MRQSVSRLGLWVGGGYLALVCLALGITFLPRSGAFSGVYAVTLTLPWSWGLGGGLDAISPALLDLPAVGPVGILICGILNALLLYKCSGRIRRKR